MLAWYVRRLRSMTAAEIAHRAREQVGVLALRGDYLLRRHRRQASSPARFYFCCAVEPQLPELAWEQEAIDDANGSLLSGAWMALGHRWVWNADDTDVWRRAPDTGLLWPERFYADIPIRRGHPAGDVRVAWEPSRLQQLLSLALFAKARPLSKEGRAAVSLLEGQLESWVDANPPWRGIHYISAMECALRLIAVSHALDMVRNRLTQRSVTWSKALKLVVTHAHFISRRLSLHSSCGNHTIAEAAGLVYAGVLYPEATGAAMWRKVGLSLLAEQADRQVLPDGGGIEHALHYHVFVLELIILVSQMLCARSFEVPDALLKAVRRGRAFLLTLASRPSALPNFGDSDGGFALSRHLKVLWEDAPPAKANTEVSSHCHAGLSVVTCAGRRPVTIAFDHGPLGMEPNYGHGHADALSVLVRGRHGALLIDPGTYTYTGDRAWRRYFRSTRAHNTVCVDGLDQAEQIGPFMWRHAYDCRLIHQRVERKVVRLVACHDGYGRLGVKHWRGIAILSSGMAVIWDYLAGSGIHEFELNWHCAGEVRRLDDRIWIRHGGSSLLLALSGGKVSLHSGETSPPRGWRSPTYGVRLLTTTVSCAAAGKPPHEFLTTMVLRPGIRVPEAAVEAEVGAFRDCLT